MKNRGTSKENEE